MKYAFIVENSALYSITRLCSVIEVSRRGYYDWLTRPESARALSNRQLLIEIRRIFYVHREVYGAPRIHRTLVEEGHRCSLNRVARLMRRERLIPKTIKKLALQQNLWVNFGSGKPPNV